MKQEDINTAAINTAAKMLAAAYWRSRIELMFEEPEVKEAMIAAAAAADRPRWLGAARHLLCMVE